MPLPPQFPIYDVQCTRCLFRAQVKTVGEKPRGVLFGAAFEIVERNKRTGQLPAPLIANFRWRSDGRWKQEIYFFPFLTQANVRSRRRSKDGARTGYREFNYVGLLAENVARVRLYP